jgi:hypothetical protein
MPDVEKLVLSLKNVEKRNCYDGHPNETAR